VQCLTLAAKLPALGMDFSVAGYADEATANVPRSLGSSEADTRPLKSLSKYMRGPLARDVKACTAPCLESCIRGEGIAACCEATRDRYDAALTAADAAGGPAPRVMGREPVVFKEQFRSRQYCLRECTEGCGLRAEQRAADKAAK